MSEPERTEPTVDGQPDPELAELPPAPKWQRTLTLVIMAATVVTAGLLAWSLRKEAGYALLPPRAVDVGDLRDARLTAAYDNRFVKAYAHLEPRPALQYSRWGEQDQYRLVPVAGAPAVWVEHRVPAAYAGPRFLPPSRVAGRLVRVSELGVRHRGIATALGTLTGGGDTAATWLLLDGTDPEGARWSLALAALLAAFAIWNIWGIASITRRFHVP